MNDLVRTIDLSKRYGQRTVVDRLNLRVPRGAVYGFLGPNGSGKSTTMKMLLSLVQPSAGQVLIGEPMNRSTRRRHLAHIGSLIESPPGYGHLTGAENMRIVQRLLDLPDRYVKHAVDTVRLGGQMDKRVREYSLGMKQRLGIAMALARRPSLLILDEPTNGLDPAGIEEIRRLLRSLAADGVTVIVSSHLLGEIDRVATVLGIVSRGGLLFQGTRAELMSTSVPDTLLGCSRPLAAAHLLSARGTASAYEHGLLRVPGLSQQATADVVALLVREGIGVHAVRQEEQTLEDVFMALTQGGGL